MFVISQSVSPWQAFPAQFGSKVRAYSSEAHFRWSTPWQAPSFSSKHQTSRERPVRDKHSSLLQTFMNSACKEFYNIGPRAKRYKGLYLQTLQLSTKISKLRAKKVFITLGRGHRNRIRSDGKTGRSQYSGLSDERKHCHRTIEGEPTSFQGWVLKTSHVCYIGRGALLQKWSAGANVI